MRRFFLLLILALLAAVTARSANAQCLETGHCLAPQSGCGYFGTGPITFGGTTVEVRNLNLSSFSTCDVPPGAGLSSDSFFDVFCEMEISMNGGGTWSPAQGTAHSGEHDAEHADAVTFDTEMLKLDLSLPGGVMIRESPTLASVGSTTLADQGGGTFKIDSFFDVFTELSLDGGVTWHPGSSTRITCTQETATPVRSSTWGALKLLYR